MKAGLAALALAMSFLFLSSACAADPILNPGGPSYANSILNGFITPTVRPGQTVMFSFNITNPYPEPNGTMNDLTLELGVYRYSTQETAKAVDQDFKHAPSIEGFGPEITSQLEPITPGNTTRIDLHIATSKHTPHGSYFSQSTYFMRFKLTFNFTDSMTPVVLQSKGYFTDDQWNQMVSFEANQSIVDTTYMKSLGVDGLLPDSAFGLKVPIPRWPLGIIIGAIGVLSSLALYYYVLDNPGKYPKLEKRFYYLRGKLRELRSELKDRRRK
jgi:hypothetical protein